MALVIVLKLSLNLLAIFWNSALVPVNWLLICCNASVTLEKSKPNSKSNLLSAIIL